MKIERLQDTINSLLNDLKTPKCDLLNDINTEVEIAQKYLEDDIALSTNNVLDQYCKNK